MGKEFPKKATENEIPKKPAEVKFPKQAEHMKQQREKHGYKQIEVCSKLNKDYKTYRKWEKGRERPDGETLEFLSSLYGVSTDYLLGLIEEKDHDIKFIHDETGLSESAIEYLQYCDSSEKHYISAFLCNSNFQNIISDVVHLEMFVNDVHEYTNLKKRYDDEFIQTAEERRKEKLREIEKIENTLFRDTAPIEELKVRTLSESQTVIYNDDMDTLENSYNDARLYLFELSEMFSDLIEEIVPHKDIFNEYLK